MSKTFPQATPLITMATSLVPVPSSLAGTPILASSLVVLLYSGSPCSLFSTRQQEVSQSAIYPLPKTLQ